MREAASRLLVDQFVPQLAPRDAASNHTLGMHSALRRAGLAGRIWCDRIDPELDDLAEPRDAYDTARHPAGERTAQLYQAFMGSPAMVGFLCSSAEPLALYYHNITPGTLLRAYDPEAALVMDEGREELKRLVPRVRVALAASGFNAHELRTWGAEEVHVLPPYGRPPSAAVDGPYLDRLRQSRQGADLLFVGRVAPHKGHRHLLRVVAALRAAWERPVRLWIVGPPGPEAYMAALRSDVEQLALSDAVTFTGSVTDQELAAHYQAADVFLCMSEHEGYCLPLVDAMRVGLPIIAFDAGAVAETLGGAGILLRSLDPLLVAEVVVRTIQDEDLRDGVRARQLRRAGELDSFDRDGQLLRAVDTLAAAG